MAPPGAMGHTTMADMPRATAARSASERSGLVPTGMQATAGDAANAAADGRAERARVRADASLPARRPSPTTVEPPRRDEVAHAVVGSRFRHVTPKPVQSAHIAVGGGKRQGRRALRFSRFGSTILRPHVPDGRGAMRGAPG